MRHLALQTLTWGTIAGTTTCALWLASKDTLGGGAAPLRTPAMLSAVPAARPGAVLQTGQAPALHAAPPAVHRADPRPVVLLEAGQSLHR